ncbi:MAG: hypothetical protein AAF899_11180 [Pseudomonadota bacterium]
MPLELSAPPAGSTTASVGALTTADFLLGPEAFVMRCSELAAEVGAADSIALDAGERTRLIAAIRSGRSRLEVARAVLGNAAGPLPPSPARALGREWDSFAVVELLERFAPDDDVRFAEQVFEQLLGRRPSQIEALEARFDLASGDIDRRTMIARVAAMNPHCRLSRVTHEPKGDRGANVNPHSTRDVSSAMIGHDGREQVLIARCHPDLGWLIGADIECRGVLGPQHAEAPLSQVPEGWILTGPKRTLKAGRWDLAVDLVQPGNAQITLDIVANSGLDTLLSLDLIGPALMTVGFDVAVFHHFLEIRINKPRQADELHQLKLRRLALELAA